MEVMMQSLRDVFQSVRLTHRDESLRSQRLETSLDERNNHISHLDKLVCKNQTRKEHLETTIHDLRKNLKKTSRDLARLTEQLSQERTEVERRVLEDELQQVRAGNDKERESLEKTERELNDCRGQIKQLTDDLVQAQDMKKDITEELRRIEQEKDQRLSQYETELFQLKQQAIEHKFQLTTQENVVLSLRQENAELLLKQRDTNGATDIANSGLTPISTDGTFIWKLVATPETRLYWRQIRIGIRNRFWCSSSLQLPDWLSGQQITIGLQRHNNTQPMICLRWFMVHPRQPPRAPGASTPMVNNVKLDASVEFRHPTTHLPITTVSRVHMQLLDSQHVELGQFEPEQPPEIFIKLFPQNIQ